MLENVLQDLGPLAQTQVVGQRFHDVTMAGVADRPIVQRTDLATERLTERASPPDVLNAS